MKFESPESNCPRLLYAQHIEGCGEKFFAEICHRDLEGIVGKPRMSVYKDDGHTWVKIKNRTYSQAEGRHELLTAVERKHSRTCSVLQLRGLDRPPEWGLSSASLAESVRFAGLLEVWGCCSRSSASTPLATSVWNSPFAFLGPMC